MLLRACMRVATLRGYHPHPGLVFCFIRRRGLSRNYFKLNEAKTYRRFCSSELDPAHIYLEACKREETSSVPRGSFLRTFAHYNYVKVSCSETICSSTGAYRWCSHLANTYEAEPATALLLLVTSGSGTTTLASGFDL